MKISEYKRVWRIHREQIKDAIATVNKIKF